MSSSTGFEFHIDALHPDTVSMERLACYLLELSRLFGSKENVHFDRVEEGSLALHQTVDEVAVQDVRNRLKAANDPEFSDVHRAYLTLNEMLAKDAAVGTLGETGASDVIAFPGRNFERPQIYKVQQVGSIEGVVIRIGGKDSTSHVSLQDDSGKVENCTVNRDQAKKLATHLYGAPVRLNGIGVWTRNPQGEWGLDKFKATGFEVLRENSLSEDLDSLRDIPGCEWGDVSDPVAYVSELRGDN